jgi:hypothetical protein
MADAVVPLMARTAWPPGVFMTAPTAALGNAEPIAV